MIQVTCKNKIRRAGIDLKKGVTEFADNELTQAQLAQIKRGEGVTITHVEESRVDEPAEAEKA